jgi:hypothetical protein
MAVNSTWNDIESSTNNTSKAIRKFPCSAALAKSQLMGQVISTHTLSLDRSLTPSFEDLAENLAERLPHPKSAWCRVGLVGAMDPGPSFFSLSCPVSSNVGGRVACLAPESSTVHPNRYEIRPPQLDPIQQSTIRHPPSTIHCPSVHHISLSPNRLHLGSLSLVSGRNLCSFTISLTCSLFIRRQV